MQHTHNTHNTHNTHPHTNMRARAYTHTYPQTYLSVWSTHTVHSCPYLGGVVVTLQSYPYLGGVVVTGNVKGGKELVCVISHKRVVRGHGTGCCYTQTTTGRKRDTKKKKEEEEEEGRRNFR